MVRSLRFCLVSLALLLLLLASSCSPVAGDFDLENQTLIPGLAKNELNGRSFSQDNVATSGNNQFVVWIDNSGRPMVSKRLLTDTSGEFEFTKDLSTLPGNPFQSPNQEDFHNVFSVGVDNQGYIHVIGNMHGGAQGANNGQLKYARSLHPYNLGSWITPQMIGDHETSATYPRFVNHPDGSLIFLYRSGISGSGDVYMNILDPGSSSPQGSAWRRVGLILKGRSPSGTRETSENGYLQHVVMEKDGTMHLMFIWRKNVPVVAANSDLSYARTTDKGVTWQKADGTQYPSLPITHQTAEVVWDTPTNEAGLSNGAGMSVDSQGRIHTALTKGYFAPKTYHVWFDGTWHREDLGVLGKSRPSVFSNTAGKTYLLHNVDDPQIEGRKSLEAFDVTAGPVSGSSQTLFTHESGGWEPTFDSRSLRERNELVFLVPKLLYLQDDGGLSSWAAVATYDANQ